MKIRELIESSSNIYHRGKSHALSKPMGKVLLHNQMVTVFKNQTVINISMMITGVTDMIKFGDSRRPVAYHRATISIKGVDQVYYTPSQLVAAIRSKHTEYANQDKYKNADILKAALENPSGFFENATIFRTTNDSGRGFSVVSNEISEDSEIQVWCSCSDYYWTMQFYNCEHGADVYQKYPSRYIPKTKAGFEAFKQNKPLRNPSRSPGMCKHLMLLLATLMEKGVIEKGSNLSKYYKVNYNKFQMEERITISAYEDRVDKWKADQKIKLKQRAVERSKIGYKKSGWNNKTHTHNITNISSNGNSTFNPITQKRTYKNRKKRG